MRKLYNVILTMTYFFQLEELISINNSIFTYGQFNIDRFYFEGSSSTLIEYDNKRKAISVTKNK